MKKTNLLMNFLAGVGIGNLIMLIFCFIHGQIFVSAPGYLEKFDNPLTGLLIQNIIYGIFGIVGGLQNYIYDRFEVLKASIIGYFLIIVYFVFCGGFLHWFQSTSQLMGAVLSFTIIYVLIWFFNYYKAKKEIEEINKKLG